MEIQKGICYWEREMSVSFTICVLLKNIINQKIIIKRDLIKSQTYFQFKLVDISKYLYMLHLKIYIYVAVILDTAYSVKF